MQTPDPVDLIATLSATGSRAVVVATGGGSRAISRLVTTPGASAVVLEGLVPYAREAVDRLLGGRQESYCSPRAARRLAIAAWQRCVGYGSPTERAVGAAVVASLRTVVPKRGTHRIIVATQTLAATTVAMLELEKDARNRDDEEELAAALLLARLEAAADAAPRTRTINGLRSGERVEFEHTAAPPEWQRLLAGSSRALCLAAGHTTESDTGAPAADRLLFPGSFDPLHDGHRTMARIAEEIAERPVDYELSIANVDKPLLDYHEIATRVAQFTDRTLWLTRAATFLEKVALFPQSTFVLGADTYVRLADPRYYGGSGEAAAAAVRTIAERARGLLVFGRVRDGEFADPAKLDVPQPLRDISYFVSQREFRMDVSSTALRKECLPCDAS
ncbi:MAG: hypothetical protein WCR51_12010 [Planctomycetia bacterium]